MNFVHNDIKLENILVGHKHSNLLYLIDFGLASNFLTEEGEHIEKIQMYQFSGNILFASLNACRGNNKSRRDDIESAFYVLIYLLNDATLPWSDFSTKYTDRSKDFQYFLRKRLCKKYTLALFAMIP